MFSFWPVGIVVIMVSSNFRLALQIQGWSEGAMVLGKLPVPGRPTNLDSSRETCISFYVCLFPFLFVV